MADEVHGRRTADAGRASARGCPAIRRALSSVALIALAAMLSSPASAQSLGLRGTDKDKEKEQAEQAPPPPPPYVPSTEAEDAQANATDLFVDKPLPDDTFAAPDATASRVPSTAIARKRDAAAGATTAAAPKPAVDAATTGSTTYVAPEGRIVPDEDLQIRREATRETAIDQRGLKPEAEPFAPVGIRVGTFILRPSIEQGATTSTNTKNAVGGSSGVLSETTLRLNAISDWSRHQLTVDAYGNFRRSLSGDDIRETRIGVDSVLNLDLSDELSGRITAGYARQPESATSPVTIEGTIDQPIRQILSGSAGLRKELGKARFGVTGSAERSTYGDAELSSGGSISQSDRNSTLYALTLRGGYEISPALTPFLEGEVGRRVYDEQTDSSGYQRSSDRLGMRAGVELAVSEKINGEISAGYLRESFDDDRLAAVGGPSVNANLVWSPVRGTDVSLSASTDVEGATNAGESGSLLHSGTLRVDRQVRHDLTAYAALGAGYRNYTGVDTTDRLLNAEIGATWWLNRYLGLTGRLRHESLNSSDSTRDYHANSAFLGLRLQR